MKIALCLYGQPRCIDNPNIKKTINEKILSHHSIDVYGHFWYDDAVQKFHGSDWLDTSTEYHQGGPFDVIPNTLDIIKDNYNLTNLNNFVYEPPKDFSNILTEDEMLILSKKSKNPWDNNNFYSPNNVNSLLSHLYSIETALNLIPNNTYDFVILTRYDTLILKFPTLSTLERGYVYLNRGYNDNMIIIDGNMTNALKCYSNIKNLIDKIQMWIAEYVKMSNIEYFYGKNAIRITNIGESMVGVARNKTDCIGQN